MAIKTFKEFEISDDKNLLQIEQIHSFLKEAYWCKGIPLKTLQSAVESSLCFGVYKNKNQVAFARVITDAVTFAWICDVIVDEKYRGQGIGKEMIQFVMAHPKLKGLRRICLATKDAHQLYKQFGFHVTETPQNWMEIKDNDIYLR